ncbi:hypothetical protein [Haliangium sp. UPWRP_2]|uniref:hypothetical protein n=1 Tax=Haliangium sp. UPWRP_2 TaxID=1931276 RepID=UPI000B544465|nr:hypothetical protein [Haliangium sp. UPWRP_2]PSM31571.1 hypothetical protein BVG81_004735 [Haliangium sp. UPWRP_2]
MLDSQNGAKPTQQFSVTGQRPDGPMSGPLAVTYSVPPNGIGTIDPNTGVFTATGEVGGTVDVTATVISNGVSVTATMQITVHISKIILTPGTPADAATRFTGTPVANAAKSANLV